MGKSFSIHSQIGLSIIVILFQTSCHQIHISTFYFLRNTLKMNGKVKVNTKMTNSRMSDNIAGVYMDDNQ